MTYKELQQALQAMSLDNRATLREIKKRHRDLVKQFHPDCSEETDNLQQIQEINAAYSLLMEYVGDYRFSFDQEEFYAQNPEENIRRQFMDDPVWGGGTQK